ncbi:MULTISPECIES: class I SAM-dependent methyltransferase [unclassified Moorena]|nr:MULTISPECIES: class I SAM-dependent methyltransferase [unclassified Moorena]NEO22170.1 class I SAM-dependent methyltransferase [Moorena sp. SIO4A5]NEQ57599.1 class I SAM-dependent methyltransferase [Moorena sp. SIO4A1]
MVNQYTEITKYYDLWVTSGYYDYQSLAKEAHSIVGDGRQVLELGVGTGLLAQKYIELDPTCEFTGIDFTASMLEIAKQRLVNQVKLIEADAVTMDLNAKFDVAISNGGVWGILDRGDQAQWQFGGHVPGLEANRQGLANVGRHLKEGGLLLLHLQKPHDDFDKSLGEGIVYSQCIEEGEDTPNYYTFEKRYFFKKDG